MKRVIRFVLLLVVSVTALRAAQPDVNNLNTILASAVEQKRVPMAVAMIASVKGTTFEHASGVGKDAIFAIASMTKPITSVAIMQLVEAGRIKLDEPAATYVPELGGVQVIDSGKLRAPKSPPTVRQLLTHTAGFGYEFLNADLLALVAKKQIPSVTAGGDAFLKAPLVADPGVQWEYGINTDWLGKIVERVSGQSLEAYFRQRIFDPLGMPDSFFVVPAGKQSRLVKVFARGADGNLEAQPAPLAPATSFFSGGGGLHSTAADYVRFMRAILNGGELDGRRILSAQSVQAMGSNQIGSLPLREMSSVIPQLAASGAPIPGEPDKFSFGFALNSKPTSNGRGVNTMSWGGIYNTFFWIDREKQLAAVLMTQMLPFLEAGPNRLINEFERAVYATRSR